MWPCVNDSVFRGLGVQGKDIGIRFRYKRFSVQEAECAEAWVAGKAYLPHWMSSWPKGLHSWISCLIDYRAFAASRGVVL